MTEQTRNKNLGLPDGGRFAADQKADGDVSLRPFKDESAELSGLRDRVGITDEIRDAAANQFFRANAIVVDKLISELFPDAVTARFGLTWDDTYAMKELRDADGNSVYSDTAESREKVDRINFIAANLGPYGDAWLGEEVIGSEGESMGFKVGTLGAEPTPAMAVINLGKPDLSSLTWEQKSALQYALILETGLVSPVIDRGEAEYRLFDELEEEAPTAAQRNLMARIAALSEKFGGREALAAAVTRTFSWGTLEEVMADSLSDERKGTAAAVRRAVTELESKA